MMNRRELAQGLLLGIAGALAATGGAHAGETFSEAQALERHGVRIEGFWPYSRPTAG